MLAPPPPPAAPSGAPPPGGSAADGARLPAIDLLRGLAILLVILYHLDNLILFPGGFGLARNADGSAHLLGGLQVLKLVFLPFHLGRVGVNLFFVISGLCIHMRFARQQARRPDAPFSLPTFFLRRFFRIYPVYWAALAVGVFVAPFAYAAAFPDGAPPEAGGIPSLRNIAAHVFMLHAFFKPYIMSIIRSLWSIATEEQFYLLYPLVFVVIGRRISVPRIVVGLLALTLAWRATLIASNPPPATFSDGPFLVWVFGFSLPRYYEWSLGALLAWAVATGQTLAFVGRPLPARAAAFLTVRPRLVIGVGIGFILLGAASLARAQVKWMIEDPCYSTGWFLIMATLLLPNSAGARAPGAGAIAAARRWASARLQSLGRRSFSVYLLHEVALFVTAGLMRRYHLPPVTVAAPLGCALIWGLCYPFYRFIEAPFEWRSKQVGKKGPAFGPGSAAASTIAAD